MAWLMMKSDQGALGQSDWLVPWRNVTQPNESFIMQMHRQQNLCVTK